jgi:quercetin 2,3-dioxygenase
MIDVDKDGFYELEIEQEHLSLIYLLNGSVTINGNEALIEDENQLVEFHADGKGISMKGNTKSKLLFLSGKPFKEHVASWGPYVMNTQTEIMEAMRDYQQGKMGFLPVS